MELNGDFTRRVAVHSASQPWTPSPTYGVDRRMLDRIGGEVARATSIVRYAPKSSFPAHTHDGGEEFLVLDGVFSDEHGDYPANSYIRNPPTSHHSPGSRDGCVIFVKLRQFNPADRTSLRIQPGVIPVVASNKRAGVEVQQLFKDPRENVRIEQWAAGSEVRIDAAGGLEVLVLAGDFVEAGERFEAQSWLRLPVETAFTAQVGVHGCRTWIKTGHLREHLVSVAAT